MKLKEKDTMLRIAKFKLSEVQRNIKHTQLKPIEKPREESLEPVKKGGGAGVPVTAVSEVTGADLAAKMAKKQRKEEIKRQQELAFEEQMLKEMAKKQRRLNRQRNLSQARILNPNKSAEYLNSSMDDGLQNRPYMEDGDGEQFITEHPEDQKGDTTGAQSPP